VGELPLGVCVSALLMFVSLVVRPPHCVLVGERANPPETWRSTPIKLRIGGNLQGEPILCSERHGCGFSFPLKRTDGGEHAKVLNVKIAYTTQREIRRVAMGAAVTISFGSERSLRWPPMEW
jgi:hypothetical protein